MVKKIVVFASIVFCCFFMGCGKSGSAVSNGDSSLVQSQVDEIAVSSDESLTSSYDVSSVIDSPDEAEMVQYVDERISELMDDEKYQKASLDEQYTFTNDMLTSLEKDGYIKNVHYDEQSRLFSFSYANGVYGGVYLDSFSAKPGQVPMN